MGLCVCRYYLVCISLLWSWRSIWNWLLFSNRAALVQYLFICCLLSSWWKKHRLDFKFHLCPWVISLVTEKRKILLPVWVPKGPVLSGAPCAALRQGVSAPHGCWPAPPSSPGELGSYYPVMLVSCSCGCQHNRYRGVFEHAAVSWLLMWNE